MKISLLRHAYRATVLCIFLLCAFVRPAEAQVVPADLAQQATGTGAPGFSPTTIAPGTSSGVTAGATGPTGPTGPVGPTGTPADNAKASISLDLGGMAKPSQSIVLILLISVLAVAPALLMMMTSFTRIIIVLSLTRNAMGVQTIPPNQVLVGLALFLSLFVMAPTLSEMNKVGLQPYLNGTKTQQAAFKDGSLPLRKFMLKHTRKAELGLFVKASGASRPKTPESVGLTALIPAFILSEIKTAFIIGFIIFIPFLVIDLIVSSSLMSMGMMMLPPVLVSLPFKLLLFVLVDGWALIVRSLLTSFAN